jgi:hypothetical protein
MFGQIICKIAKIAAIAGISYLAAKVTVAAVKAAKPTKEKIDKAEEPIERQVTVCDDETGDMHTKTEYELTKLSFSDKAKIFGETWLDCLTFSSFEEKFMDAYFWGSVTLAVVTLGYCFGVVDYDEELGNRLDGHWKSWTGRDPDEDTPLYEKYAAAAANMAKNVGVTSFGFFNKTNGSLLGYARKDMINNFLDTAKAEIE